MATEYRVDISPGAPPLLWDDVNRAFDQINYNFESIQATLGLSGLTPVNFTNLNTGLAPAETNEYEIGSPAFRWKNIYTESWADTPGFELNGLWAGFAHIKGIGATIDLPLESTVNNQLIIDPNKTTWKTINIEGEGELIASSFTDTLNLINGDGIRITVNSGADSLTFDNTGVLKVSGTADQIGVSATGPDGTGEITLTNLGVLSLTNTGSIGTRTPGAGIHVSNDTGNIVVTNTGIIQIIAATGINADYNAATGVVELSNAYPPPGNSFRYVISDGTVIEANNSSGTLNLNSGAGISLTRSALTDTITINVNPVFDLKGSVVGDNSTMLVDAVDSRIVGDIYTSTLRTSEDSIYLGTDAGSNSTSGYTVGIGFHAQKTNPAGYTVAVGSYAGSTNQSQSAVAIGSNAGETNQGAAAVAIGNYAGQTSQHDNSLILNASGGVLNSDGTDRFYVAPIRNTTGSSGVLQYNSTTKEVSYSSALGSVSGTFTGNIFTNLIDSADSSAITITPIAVFSSDVTVQNDITAVRLFTSLIDSPDSSAITITPKTIFSSDVDIENDLNVSQRLTVNGSRVLNLADLKAVVAASTDFSDFQAKIAALV